MNKLSTKVNKSFRKGWNLDNLTYLIIYIGFPTFCEVKYFILVKKSINNRLKQPWSEKSAKNQPCTGNTNAHIVYDTHTVFINSKEKPSRPTTNWKTFAKFVRELNFKGWAKFLLWCLLLIFNCSIYSIFEAAALVKTRTLNRTPGLILKETF